MGITHTHRLKQVEALVRGFNNDDELAGFITALAVGKPHDKSMYAVSSLLDTTREVLVNRIFPANPGIAKELFTHFANHATPEVRRLVAWFVDLIGIEEHREIEEEIWRLAAQELDETVRSRVLGFLLGRHGNGTLGGDRDQQLTRLLEALKMQYSSK